MKTSTLKNADYVGTGTIIIGAVVGAMLSRAGISAVHDTNSSNSIIKDHLMIKRVAIAGASVVGSSMIESKDTLSLLVKGAGYGSALIQTVDGVKDFASTKPALTDTSTKTKRVMANALGLACPEQPANNWMNGARRKRSLRMPAVEMIQNSFSSNPLDAIYDNAKLSA